MRKTMSETGLLVFLFCIIVCKFCYGNPTVQLKLGRVQGTHKRSYDGRVYSSFEGIPYAKPPIGDLRFKEPIPASGWETILVANKTYLCSQLDDSQNVYGTEDCLYIYVYVPKEQIDRNDNFDVVVHFHGGSLVVGGPSTMVLPDYIMDKNLIMVTLNYRLGAAGFLSTGDNVVPGNNGFKDQALALKWIKNNIKEFGGNPDSVTITGWSSGGTSVHFHYLSPISRGLFHKGYAASNVVTNPSSLTPIPHKKAKELAESLQCPKHPTRSMINCLKNLPIEKLVNTTVQFKPSIERGCSKPFIPDIPYRMLKEKRVYDSPLVVSTVVNESLFSLDSLYRNRSQIFSICNNWSEWGRVWLDMMDDVDKDKLEGVFSRIKKFYMDDCKHVTEENGLEKVNRLLTDRHFHVGIDIGIRIQAAATTSRVYCYISKFIPDDRLEFGGPPAASHGTDDKLMFKFNTNPDRLKPRGEKMMRVFIDFIAEYAKTGIPKLGNVTWTPIEPNGRVLDILEINSPENIKMIKRNELGPQQFWDSLPIKENSHQL